MWCLNPAKKAFTQEEKRVALELKGITKSWGAFALKNINLAVDGAQYLVLLGPTGAGKTLLLDTIMGFNKPDKGAVLIDGKDVTDVAPEKRGIGYVPQNSVVFPHLTVRQNIAFGLKMQGKQQAKLEKTVDEMLDLAKLRSIEQRPTASLSGGEKQKLALARVLAINTQIILLDEPLASVDAETAGQLRQELKRLHREDGKTVVHVTHSLIEGFSLADKLALMNAGEIVQVGGVKAVLTKPKNEFAARLLGYDNVYKANPLETQAVFSVLDVEGVKLRVSGKVTSACMVALRPEDIAVETSAVNDVGFNVLKANIKQYADLGALVMVTADAGLTFNIAVSKNSFIEKELDVGKEVWLKIKDNAIKTIE